MPHASYSVRRLVWPVWKWEADYRGEATARGYRLSKNGARWAARGWLRNRRGPAPQPAAAADPKAMAAE